MFIKTTDSKIVELKGIVKSDKTISYDGSYKVTLFGKMGCTMLGEYKNSSSAENVIQALCVAIERDKKLFVMPKTYDYSDDNLREYIART